MNYFEVVFDIIYLVLVTLVSSRIIFKGLKSSRTEIIVFGVMGILLGFGDAFHLVPRIVAHLTTGLNDYQQALGIGKLITGVTMTVFYLLLFFYYQIIKGKQQPKILLVIVLLMVVRFFILALPGNDWIHNGNDLFYAIIRNIPFAIIGGIIIFLFSAKDNDKQFHKIAFWVGISFICYTVTLIGAPFIPVLGAFMMPKTIAYVIIVLIGYKYTIELT